MMYLLLFVLLLMLGVGPLNWRFNNNKTANLIFFLVFCLMIGLRQTSIGRDTIGYEQAFLQLLDYGETELHMEIGFLWLNRIIIFLGGNFKIVLLLSAFIPLLFVYKSLLYFKVDNIFVSYLCLLCSSFLLVYLFSGIRQGIAMGILLYGYKFVVERNLFRFTLCIICASLFHLTVIVVYPVYWLTMKIPFKLLLVASLIALVGTHLGVTKFLFSKFVSLFIGHYAAYADLYADFANSDAGYGILLRIVFWLLVAYLLSRNILSLKRQVVYNILCIGIIAYSFFLGVDILIRLSEYFLVILIIAIPYSLQSLYLKSNKYICYLLYLIVLGAIYYSTLTFEDIKLLPYLWSI